MIKLFKSILKFHINFVNVAPSKLESLTDSTESKNSGGETWSAIQRFDKVLISGEENNPIVDVARKLESGQNLNGEEDGIIKRILDDNNGKVNKFNELNLGQLYALSKHLGDSGWAQMFLSPKINGPEDLVTGKKYKVDFGNAIADRYIGAGDMLGKLVKSCTVNGIKGEYLDQNDGKKRPGYWNGNNYCAVHSGQEIIIGELWSDNNDSENNNQNIHSERWSEAVSKIYSPHLAKTAAGIVLASLSTNEAPNFPTPIYEEALRESAQQNGGSFAGIKLSSAEGGFEIAPVKRVTSQQISQLGQIETPIKYEIPIGENINFIPYNEYSEEERRAFAYFENTIRNLSQDERNIARVSFEAILIASRHDGISSLYLVEFIDRECRGFNPNTPNKSGSPAYGLGQFLPETGRVVLARMGKTWNDYRYNSKGLFHQACIQALTITNHIKYDFLTKYPGVNMRGVKLLYHIGETDIGRNKFNDYVSTTKPKVIEQNYGALIPNLFRNGVRIVLPDTYTEYLTMINSNKITPITWGEYATSLDRFYNGNRGSWEESQRIARSLHWRRS